MSDTLILPALALVSFVVGAVAVWMFSKHKQGSTTTNKSEPEIVYIKDPVLEYYKPRTKLERTLTSFVRWALIGTMLVVALKYLPGIVMDAYYYSMHQVDQVDQKWSR